MLFKDILGYKQDEHFDFSVTANFNEFEKTVSKRGKSGIEDITNYDHRYGASCFVGSLWNPDVEDKCNFTIVEALNEWKVLALTSADAIFNKSSRYVEIDRLIFTIKNNFTG